MHYPLGHYMHHITTGPLEGFNNTISRIIHRACGVRNMDYLFLKLRQESLDPDPPKWRRATSYWPRERT
jgi:hypothetical protein